MRHDMAKCGARRRGRGCRKPAPRREKTLLEAARAMLEAFERTTPKTDKELTAFCWLADAVARERSKSERRRLKAEAKAKGGAR